MNSENQHDLDRQSQAFFPELAELGDLPSVQLVRGILYDFDDTLAYRTKPIDDLMEEGARNAETYMRAQDMQLPDDFWRNIIEARLFAYEKSSEEREEHIADDALSFLLQFFGYPTSELDLDVLHRTVDIFYAPEMTAWKLFPNTLETLSTIHKSGYRQGVVANYSCDRVFQRTIDFLQLRPWLDLSLTSASVEYRKPDVGIFKIALDQWDIMAYELIVVGDDLQQDIAGAINVGALAVLAQLDATRQNAADSQPLTDIVPDATITDLAALPALIAQWATT